MIYRILFAISIICFLALSTKGQPNLRTGEALPLDESIRYGKLANGFTYYIKPVASPSPKLNMRLIVKGGASQQDRDQLDIAHFVEHMAFKSSKHFPLGVNNAALLDSLKMSFRDLTAGAGRYYTSYSFDPPANNMYAVEKGLLWFKDIVGGSLNLITAEIDAERAVLRQEKIGKMVGHPDLMKLSKPALTSKIDPGAKTHGMGDEYFFEHNRTFDPDVLRRFYHDWYRPDLAAIMVVGTIHNVDSLEAVIKASFSEIDPQEHSRKWQDTDSAYFNQPPQVAKVAWPRDRNDKINIGDVVIHLGYRDPVTRQCVHTEEGMKRTLIWSLLTSTLNERFNTLAERYNADFDMLSKYVTPNSSLQIFYVANVFGVCITSENNSEKEAVETTVKYLRQLYQYGLTAEEWDTLQQEQLRWMNKDNSGNAQYWFGEMTKHHMHGEALPEGKNTYLKDWLHGLSLTQVNKVIKNLISDMPEEIGIAALEGHDILALGENDIRSWISEAWRTPVHSYTPPNIPKRLMNEQDVSSLQKRGFTDNGVKQTGAREVVLENGMTVVLLPQTGGAGTIKVHGFSQKGALSFSGEDFYSAIHAAAVVRNAGVGDMDRFEIDRYISSTGIDDLNGVRPYINPLETGIKGETSLASLEDLLQLVYLYFSAPRNNERAFSDWRNSDANDMHRHNIMAGRDFSNSINALVGDPEIAGQSTAWAESLSRADMDRAYECYKDLFGSAKDFTFLISGDFDMDTVLPIAQKYLGNIPNQGHIDHLHSITYKKAKLEKGPVLHEIPTPSYGMKDMKYAQKYFVDGLFNWRENIKVQVLGSMIGNQLLTTLRNQGFPVYTPNGGGNYNFECGRYEIHMGTSFNADGNESESELQFELLREAVHQMVEEIKVGSIGKDAFAQALKNIQGWYYSSLDNNTSIQKRLYETYRYDAPWLSQTQVDDFFASLTFEDVMDTAKRYLDVGNRHEFIMGLHENKKQGHFD